MLERLTQKTPKRPYKNLADFRQHKMWDARDFFDVNPTLFPCFLCGGRGRIYDPQDPPDPIEGNKLRSRIKCPECKGSRCCSRAEFLAVYNGIINEWKERKRAFLMVAKNYRSAIKKLSPAEIQALRTIGL